jgi:hypothetical protein
MTAPPSRAKALLQGLVALLVGLGLFAFVLESGLRFAGYVPEDLPYGYDANLAGDLLADKHYTAGRISPIVQGPTFSPYRLDTNGQGFRADEEVQIPKPGGLRRVLVLGDSFVFGPFVDNHETASAQLQAMLNARLEYQVQVVSAAMPGWTLLDQYEYLIEKGLRLEPDLVVAQSFVNDVRESAPFFRQVLSRQTYKDQAQSPLFQVQLFLRRHCATYYALRQIKDRFEVARHLEAMPDSAGHDYRPHWQEYLKKVEELHACLRQRDVELLFVLVPEFPGGDTWSAPWPALAAVSVDSLASALALADRAEANRLLSSNHLLPLLRAELAQRGIGHLDLLAIFARLQGLAASPRALYLLPHDGHLSPFGHLVLAQALAEYISRHRLL